MISKPLAAVKTCSTEEDGIWHLNVKHFRYEYEYVKT